MDRELIKELLEKSEKYDGRMKELLKLAAYRIRELNEMLIDSFENKKDIE